MLLRVLGAAAGAVLSTAACAPSSHPPRAEPCAAGFLGDPAGPPELEVQILLGDGGVAIVLDDAEVPILPPPQGGRVIFAGVRATNVDGCALLLTGALRNLTTQQARVESRTINLTPTGDGWGVSAVSSPSNPASAASFSNIGVCPNQWSDKDIYGQPYDLEVTILDRGMRRLEKTVRVTPECGQAPALAAECRCICKAGHILGEACGDGGTEQ